MDLRENERETLTPEQCHTLNRLLQDYRDIFNPGGAPTDFIEHAIETGDHGPISTPPYRLSQPKKEFLRQEIDRMLADGVIEECESPWAFPLVLAQARERVAKRQNRYKARADEGRRTPPRFNVGEEVLLTTHILSDKAKGVTTKFAPKRDGPYRVRAIISPTACEIEDAGGTLLGKYHVEDIHPFRSASRNRSTVPLVPKRRGRPRKCLLSVTRA